MESIDWSMKKIEADASIYSLKPHIVPSALFDSDQLMDEAALVFGCEPDRNAWLGGKFNPRPRSNHWNLRSAGGHVHVGYDKTKTSVLNMIKAMDLFLGVPAVLMDDDTTRRELYGKAGAFRPQSYGWEYRVLSCFWLRSAELVQWVYEQTHRAVQEVLSTDSSNFDMLMDEEGEVIQKAINESNTDLALSLCANYKLNTL